MTPPSPPRTPCQAPVDGAPCTAVSPGGNWHLERGPRCDLHGLYGDDANPEDYPDA